MKISSPAFHHGQTIPKHFTGEGEDISPPLEWSDAPEGTRSFALLCEDPDAPVHRPGKDHPFVHWLVYGISPSTSSLPEGLPKEGAILAPVSACQGRNSFGTIGYGGPMPPIGHGSHRYVFTLFALDADVGLRPGATKFELLSTIRPHIIAQAGTKGIYERPFSRPVEFNGKSLRSWPTQDPESRPAP